MFKLTRKKILLGISLVGLAIFPFVIWSFLIEPNQLFVVNYPIKVNGWSPKLNNFKIVAIADIHGGANFITEEKIREIVSLANAQDPDLIILLGDYVSRQTFDKTKTRMPIETVFENLKGLKAKLGVFACVGNHDNNFGNELIRKGLENIGYKVLESEADSVEKNGEKLRLVGLPDTLRNGDYLSYRNRINNALDSLENKEGKIILFSHNPDLLWTITGRYKASEDVVLFLGGHTHGGQINLPIIGPPFVSSVYGSKYAKGYFQDLGIGIFVSSGIGTSVIPARFRVPPEISVLEISAEN
ncbi:MAG: metallophosphoesterase [Pyrinomonadaceae bacterium]|nr:metallophosphoesterase [Pyrinomonadaceae bacterium]